MRKKIPNDDWTGWGELIQTVKRESLARLPAPDWEALSPDRGHARSRTASFAVFGKAIGIIAGLVAIIATAFFFLRPAPQTKSSGFEAALASLRAGDGRPPAGEIGPARWAAADFYWQVERVYFELRAEEDNGGGLQRRILHGLEESGRTPQNGHASRAEEISAPRSESALARIFIRAIKSIREG